MVMQSLYLEKHTGFTKNCSLMKAKGLVLQVSKIYVIEISSSYLSAIIQHLQVTCEKSCVSLPFVM